MDEHGVEMVLDQLDGFLVAAGLAVFLQDVAHGTQKLRARAGLFDRVEQRQQFEAHLSASEGKSLEDDNVRLFLVEGFEKQLAAIGEKFLVGRLPIGIGKAGKTDIAGDDRRQFDRFDTLARKARHGQAAGNDRYLETVLHQCIGDTARTRNVADAEQMLDIKEDAGSRHDAFCHSASNRPLNCRMLE